MFNRVAFIGIGLIGSSMARVMKRDKLAGTIVACARRQETLNVCLKLGIADEHIVVQHEDVLDLGHHPHDRLLAQLQGAGDDVHLVLVQVVDVVGHL